MENLPKAAGPDGLRVLSPRALTFVYTLRNKRDIEHVGGDVDANEIDAATAVRVADWCLCELIRSSHGLSLEEAQALLDTISARQLPQVWEVMGKKRVLDTSLSFREKTLVLLYADSSPAVLIEDLVSWLEHSNAAVLKRNVLRPLHKEVLVEFDEDLGVIVLSPTGAAYVEAELLPKVEL